MSNPIHELSGVHIGQAITVTDKRAGIEASGILFEVAHEADLIASAGMFGQDPEYIIGRRRVTVNLGGKSSITLGVGATFTQA